MCGTVGVGCQDVQAAEEQMPHNNGKMEKKAKPAMRSALFSTPAPFTSPKMPLWMCMKKTFWMLTLLLLSPAALPKRHTDGEFWHKKY